MAHRSSSDGSANHSHASLRWMFAACLTACAACTQVKNDAQATGADASAVGAGCQKDTDCKGERVCDHGQCVAPPSAAPSVVVTALQTPQHTSANTATAPTSTPAASLARLAAAAKSSISSVDAAQLRQLTHPTGNGGSLGIVTVSQEGNLVFVTIPVSWTGGVMGSSYTTTYTWRLDDVGGSDLSVASDTAVFHIDASHLALADNYFKSKRASLTP
jgi:hypothetical protein